MGTELVGNIARAVGLGNYLHDKNIILVYVENEEDVPFWKYFFERCKLHSKVSPAGTDTDKDTFSVNRGCGSVLSFASQANRHFVLCVDSDYNYLLQESTRDSRLVNTNPFVFHTYLHSKESFQCWADTLPRVMIEATLRDEIFDYKLFIEQYSEIIYELFVRFFYFYKKKMMANEIDGNNELYLLPASEFNKIVSIDKIANMAQGQTSLNNLKNKIEKKITELPVIDEAELIELRQYLQYLGVESKNTYLFIQGHTLHDKVILQILNPMFQITTKKQFADLESVKNDENKVQVDNLKVQYRKNVYQAKDDEISVLRRVLMTHKYFDENPFTNRIIEDIKGACI